MCKGISPRAFLIILLQEENTMKKLIPIILSLVLIIALSACGAASGSAKENPPSGNNVAAKEGERSASPEENLISRDRAIELALEKAGLSRDEVYDLDAELDLEKGVKYWEVDFESGGKDYEYEINALSGEIVIKEAPRAADGSSDQAEELSRDEAVAIALADAGYNLADIHDLSVELEIERGVKFYEVDFEAGVYDFEYDIDAVSGEILKREKERD